MKGALAGTNKIEYCHDLAYGCVSGVTGLIRYIADWLDEKNILSRSFCVLFRSLRLPMDILYEWLVLAPVFHSTPRVGLKVVEMLFLDASVLAVDPFERRQKSFLVVPKSLHWNLCASYLRVRPAVAHFGIRQLL